MKRGAGWIALALTAGCNMTAGTEMEPAPAAPLANAAPDAAPQPSGFDRYRARSRELARFDTGGTASRLHWHEAGNTLYFTRLGDRYSVDLASGAVTMIDGDDEPAREPRAGEANQRGRRPARGRQRTSEPSPDGEWTARCVDWNVVLEATDGSETIDVTTDGTRKHRFGMASWVYGEELNQTTAMWWSPDSRYLVYYGFDEREVPDFLLLDDLENLRPSLLREGYPKPGEANPIASIVIYDREEGTQRTVLTTETDDARHYLYRVMFEPAGDAFLVSRTNRKQDHLELLSVDLATGTVRTVLEERQATWQDNRPTLQFLDDGERFIWQTERAGAKQYELRSLSGSMLATLSDGRADVTGITRIDEEGGWFYYTQYDVEWPLDIHAWRVRLDGTDREQLTDAAGRHTIAFSPNGRYFTDRCESITAPPYTTVRRADGSEVAIIADSDPGRIADLGLPDPEVFTYTAADGETTLYGWLFKPRDFDPSRRYPLLVEVYGGPGSKGVVNRYRPGHSGCGLDILVARFDNRGTGGRGKEFLGAVYRRLGDVDIADQAAGVRALRERAYVDGERVAIQGHSYGGYMAALGILKFPDVFQVAVAGAPVTDWRHYDTIYTERYMQTPQLNDGGYDEGSCMMYVDQLEGDLLILHGMADDNVHPTNVWQLVHALQSAGKQFDMMFYPTRGHSLGGHSSREVWDYIDEHLND